MEPQYKYGLASNGECVCVDNLSRDTVAYGTTYTCPSCDDELIPHLGNHKIKHFVHKNAECSAESYLHATAKYIVANRFNACVHEARPFYLKWIKVFRCKHLKRLLAPRAEQDATTDLTKHFTIATVEKMVRGWIGDVVLSNPETGKILLIEIAVTHPCDIGKLKSNLPIIEISLESLADLETRLSDTIDENDDFTTLFNKKDEYPDEGCVCTEVETSGWIVHEGGFYEYVLEQSLRDTEAMLEPKSKFVVDEEGNWTWFIDGCFTNSVTVRDCRICTFGRKQHDYPMKGVTYRCAKHKKGIRSGEEINTAVGCREFSRFPTKRAFENQRWKDKVRRSKRARTRQ